MSQTKTNLPPTEKQRAKLAAFQKNFGLSDSDIGRCLFFSQDQEIPYVPPELLIRVARMTQQFSSIEPEFSSHVAALNQLIYKATVVDRDGRSITRIGVATIGEKPNGYEIDTHKLAEGRAIGGALTDTGFNPFKANFVVGLLMRDAAKDLGDRLRQSFAENEARVEAEMHRIDDVERRRKDLGHIKILAREKGLIFNDPLTGSEDQRPYRDWLSTNFQAHTAATFDIEQRAQVINKLKQYTADDYFLANVPADLREDALIA